MKYLKITTIVYDQNQIEKWIGDRLDEETEKELRRGEEITVKRDAGSTTQYKLIDTE